MFQSRSKCIRFRVDSFSEVFKTRLTRWPHLKMYLKSLFEFYKNISEDTQEMPQLRHNRSIRASLMKPQTHTQIKSQQNNCLGTVSRNKRYHAFSVLYCLTFGMHGSRYTGQAEEEYLKRNNYWIASDVQGECILTHLIVQKMSRNSHSHRK